jgi:FkbM family methyltransferase
MLHKRLIEQLSAKPQGDSISNPYQGIDLMALPTDEIFVTEAYRRILGRRSDIDGLHHFTEVLRTHPRQVVLDALIACVPPPVAPKSADPATNTVDVTVIDKLEPAEQFVRECYLKILGREADASGLRHYRLLLGIGVSRPQIMAILAMSDEGQQRNQTLLWHGVPLASQPLSFKHRLLLRIRETLGISDLDDGISSFHASIAGTHARLDGWNEELERIVTSIAAAERQSAIRELNVLAALERFVNMERQTTLELTRLQEEVAHVREPTSRQNRQAAEQFQASDNLRESICNLTRQIETIADKMRLRQGAVAEAQHFSGSHLAERREADQRAEANLAAVANDIRIRQDAMAEVQERHIAQILAERREADQRAEANLAAVANDIRVRQEAMAETQERHIAQIIAERREANQRAEANLAAVANDIRIRQEAMAEAQQRIRERADELLAAVRPPVLQTDDLFILRVSNLLLGVPREDLCLAALYAHWGSVDLGMSRWITSNLRPGMIFADIGASVGIHTLEAARAVGPSGKVYAFEPTPRTLAALRSNLALNGVTQVEVFPVAVMDRSGPVRLHLNHEDGSLNSIFPGEGAPEAIEVPGLPLDEALAGREKVDIIKIDAEGAESLILRGMTNVLARNPDIVLLLEFAPQHLVRAGVNAAEYLAQLRSMGFRIKRLDELTGDVLSATDQEFLETVSSNLCLDRISIQ